MAQPLNRQVGTQLVTRRPPKLDGYVVVGGSWKPKNLLKNSPAENEDEEIFNHTFYSPGDQVDCELYQKVTTPATADLQPSQVITEIAADENPAPGKWLVLKADPIDFGLRQLKFQCTLERHDAEDLTITS